MLYFPYDLCRTIEKKRTTKPSKKPNQPTKQKPKQITKTNKTRKAKQHTFLQISEAKAFSFIHLNKITCVNFH